MKPIFQIVDESLLKMRKQVFPMTWEIGEVPSEMLDLSFETEEDYIGWKAIPSKITKAEILAFEKELGFSLPKSYKIFLQYKCFIQLHLRDIAIGLPHILPKSKLSKLREMNFENYFSEELIGKGYFYFADFYDYGFLAFDTNKLKTIMNLK